MTQPRRDSVGLAISSAWWILWAYPPEDAKSAQAWKHQQALDQKRSGIARDRTLQRMRPFREVELDASVGFRPEERSTSFGEFASVCTEYYCASGRRIRQAPSVTKSPDSAAPASAGALPLA